jgi:hypothetical protein
MKSIKRKSWLIFPVLLGLLVLTAQASNAEAQRFVVKSGRINVQQGLNRISPQPEPPSHPAQVRFQHPMAVKQLGVNRLGPQPEPPDTPK